MPSYHPNDRDWIVGALPAEDLTPCYRFLLRETVYTGAPNDHAQWNDPAFNPPVALPEFPRRVALRPTSRESLGHEAELASYYRRVRDLVPRKAALENYWLHLSFEGAAGSVGFPWWDRFGDADELMTWLKSGSAGTGFLDMDQGWMFRALRTEDDRFHFLDADWEDDDRVRAKFSVDRAAFLARLAEAERDTLHVIDCLERTLGMDPWSGARRSQ